MAQPTKDELKAYIERKEKQLPNTASPWMRSEIRKAIKLAKSELAKLERTEPCK